MNDRLAERRALFDVAGLHRADFEIGDDEGWTRSEELAAILRFSTMRVLKVGPGLPLRVRFALFPDLTFTHASSGPARILWSRDELSRDRVLAVITRTGHVEVESDGVVVRRPGAAVVAPGDTPVTVTLTAPSNEVFYAVVSARRLGIEFPEVSISLPRPPDPVPLGPLIPFIAGLCTISVDGAQEADPLLSAAQEIARTLVSVIVGEHGPASLFARAMEMILVDHADPALSVGSIAPRLGVSTRTVQLAFSAEGTTAVAQLRGIRARAAFRLREIAPSMADAAIARAVGFGSDSSMYRAMREIRTAR